MNWDRLIAWVLRWEWVWLYLAIPLVSVLMHWTIWDKDIRGPHVWRQSGTQQTIDSFVEEDFCILNPRRLERGTTDGISRVEFPLYQWLIAAVAKVAGNSVLLMRMITFIMGCLGIWAMQRILVSLTQNRLAGLIGAFLFAFAPVVYYYMVCALPDIFALVMAMWGLVYLLRLEESFRWRDVVIGAAFLGVAMLVKLPYGIFLPGFGVWFLREWRRTSHRPWAKALGIVGIGALALVPAALWYAWVIPTWGSSGAISGVFFHLTDWAEIKGFAWYHLTEMFPRTVINSACLPLIVWGLLQLIRKKAPIQKGKGWILLTAGFTVLLYYGYEIWLIGTAHDYYLLPFVPFWVILAAIGGANALQSQSVIPILGAIVLLVAVPYMTYRRIHPRWQDQNAEMNLDFARYKNELRAAIPDDALAVVGTDESRSIVPYFVHKKCWGWTKSQGISAEKLQEYIDKGAEYMYCDDRIYDEDPAIKTLLDTEIARFGSVRVYRLAK